MAIEYLYDCIRATAGQDICVCAVITDDSGEAITDGCKLMLSEGESDSTLLTTINGDYDGEQWNFHIPAAVTHDLYGRYWYCVCRSDTKLCFKTPIYLM